MKRNLDQNQMVIDNKADIMGDIKKIEKQIAHFLRTEESSPKILPCISISFRDQRSSEGYYEFDGRVLQ